MIVVPRPSSWLRNLFRYKGTALRRIWRRLLFTVGVSVIITWIDLGPPIPVPGTDWSLHYQFHEDLTIVPFSLVGVALGIFLGFRNNTSYDRFWEGRKLWGRMVNVSRTFTRQILTLIGPIPHQFDGRLTDGHRNPYRGELPSDEQRQDDPDVDELLHFHEEMVHRVAAYVHMFRMHLRDEDDLDSLYPLIEKDEIEALRNESNRPVALLQTLGDRIREAWLRGWIHSQHVPVLEGSLTEMTGVQGGCERIKATPIPFSYTALIHRIVAVYCYALPFGILNETKEFTPVVVLIIAYAFFGLDAVGDEIEDPFGKDDNDLPLSQLSTMIEVNVRQRIGDEDLPALKKPVNEVLS
ncbi:MAG TPA: bestrophin family protein [Sandaracinaceae bacterium LLY-WYZ-13_1]|nr:bestrophin family protein [Sandaracinaceae bacterium LLY-WYZ-13_1]